MIDNLFYFDYNNKMNNKMDNKMDNKIFSKILDELYIASRHAAILLNFSKSYILDLKTGRRPVKYIYINTLLNNYINTLTPITEGSSFLDSIIYYIRPKELAALSNVNVNHIYSILQYERKHKIFMPYHLAALPKITSSLQKLIKKAIGFQKQLT